MIISVIRTILLYIFIIIALRLMGKRQISDMQTSELVITLIISDISVIPMQDNSIPMLTGIVPMLVLISIEIFLSVIMLKSTGIRQLICGKPIVIIKDGVLLQSAMRKLRLSTEDLFAQLRMQQIFALDDIAYCIAETNGQISVLLKSQKQTLTLGDVKKDANNQPSVLQAVVVNDGILMENSIKICNLTKNDILQEISKSKIALKDIFIMTATTTGEYSIIKREI